MFVQRVRHLCVRVVVPDSPAIAAAVTAKVATLNFNIIFASFLLRDKNDVLMSRKVASQVEMAHTLNASAPHV